MILYYSPGACGLADHISLRESGRKFDLVKVNLKSHTLEDGRSFKEINPKGYVPALQLDDGEIVTENIAILAMIADDAPQLGLAGPLGRTRLLESLSYISSEIHKSFKPLFTPDATGDEKSKAGDLIEHKLNFVATQMKWPFWFGDNVSVADASLFVMLMWSANKSLAIPAKLVAFSDRMKDRPAVQRALADEGIS